MIPIVVLASGRGSNFQAIHRAIVEGKLRARIEAVVSDQKDAAVLQKASDAGLRTFVVPFPEKREGQSIQARRDEHGRLLLEKIAELKPRYLVLAGYMRIVSSLFLQAWSDPRGFNRVVNVHPSLLPSFPGVESYSQAFNYGVHIAGATVHLVDDGLDQGPICAQEAFSISDCLTVSEVEARGLAVEHRLYPETLNWILSDEFRVEKRPDGRLCVRKN